MRPHAEATNVIAIDDPELFKYPVAFMVEAGYLTLSDKEVLALRKYLLRGGFLIIDDTREDAFPRSERLGRTWCRCCRSCCRISIRSIWTCRTRSSTRFSISPRSTLSGSTTTRGRRSFAESSRTTTRRSGLLVMINFNTDISNFWEYSALGFMPMEESNEAYELGVNDLFYALTHRRGSQAPSRRQAI